jgi:hypothetical protein
MTGIHFLATALGAIQTAFSGEGAIIYLGFADHEFRTSLLAKLERFRPVLSPPAAALGQLQEQRRNPVIPISAGPWAEPTVPMAL